MTQSFIYINNNFKFILKSPYASAFGLFAQLYKFNFAK